MRARAPIRTTSRRSPGRRGSSGACPISRALPSPAQASHAVSLLDSAARYRSRDAEDYAAYFALSAQSWAVCSGRNLFEIFGNRDDLRTAPPQRTAFRRCGAAAARSLHQLPRRRRLGRVPGAARTKLSDLADDALDRRPHRAGDGRGRRVLLRCAALRGRPDRHRHPDLPELSGAGRVRVLRQHDDRVRGIADDVRGGLDRPVFPARDPGRRLARPRGAARAAALRARDRRPRSDGLEDARAIHAARRSFRASCARRCAADRRHGGR